MNFEKSIKIEKYTYSANKEFDQMQERLTSIENSFQTKMNGKTLTNAIGSFVGTAGWLVVFVAAAIFAGQYVNGILLAVFMVLALALIGFMMVDNYMNYSFCKKITEYGASVSQLKGRVTVGKSSVRANHDAFMASKAQGWHYALSAGTSIPEEATSIETTVSSIESLKNGFISKIKTVLYFATAVALTVTSSLALFPVTEDFIGELSSLDSDVIFVFNIIGLIVAVVGEVIMAKLVWSKTNCNITNITLFILLLAPVAFIVFMTLATLIVAIIIGILYIAIYIIGIVIVGGIAFACLCGG